MAEQYAGKPRVPVATRALQRAMEQYREYAAGREVLERVSVARGLLALAVLVLLGSVARAGLGRAFVPVWWKQW